jgi:hypothetical protein
MPLATYLVVVSLAVAFAVIALVRTRASVMKMTLSDVV